MRIALFIYLLSISLHSSAQTPLPQSVLSALKSDNSVVFLDAVSDGGLARCYSYKNSSYTPLIMTIKAGAIDSFNALLVKGADVEKTCSSKSPLMYAAKYGQLEMAKSLIKAGAYYEHVNSKGRSAKDYSKKYKQKEIYLYFKSIEADKKGSSNAEKFRDW